MSKKELLSSQVLFERQTLTKKVFISPIFIYCLSYLWLCSFIWAVIVLFFISSTIRHILFLLTVEQLTFTCQQKFFPWHFQIFSCLHSPLFVGYIFKRGLGADIGTYYYSFSQKVIIFKKSVVHSCQLRWRWRL